MVDCDIDVIDGGGQGAGRAAGRHGADILRAARLWRSSRSPMIDLTEWDPPLDPSDPCAGRRAGLEECSAFEKPVRGDNHRWDDASRTH